MKYLILFIVFVCLQLTLSNGLVNGQQGVGAFAYQDSTGNRYGGTYGLKDGQVFHSKGTNDFAVPFAPNTLYDQEDFIPEYFRNLENLLQEVFHRNLQSQRLAFNAARKAFDLTSNHAGYIPNFPSRFNPFSGFPRFTDFGGAPTFDMPGYGFGQNSAFASAAAGPGYSRQVASINPANPSVPNVDVTNRFGSTSQPGEQQFYSVSSSSRSSSSDINGQPMNTRMAETVVNNNGQVTRYKVQS